MIGIKGAERNGVVVAAHAVSDDESVIAITSDQLMVRSAVAQFRVQSRTATGVKLVRLNEGETLVSLSVCEGEEEDKNAAPIEGDAPAAPTEPTETPTETPPAE